MFSGDIFLFLQTYGEYHDGLDLNQKIESQT